MPAITVSAVNTSTDTLTGTAHGLLTGDRFRVRNVGGALPTGLAAVTDYFAIRVDANNVKPATSSANALAGTPVVDITGAGSGTTTIEYGLPYCIPTALAAAGGQIKSANDNGAWNALVALYALLTAQAQAVWSTIVIALTVTFNALVTFAAGATAAANQHITVSGTGRFKHGTMTKIIAGADLFSSTGTPTTTTGAELQGTPLNASGGLELDVGKRVLAIRAYVKDSATGPTLIRLNFGSVTSAGVQTNIGNVTSTGAGTDQTLSLGSLTTTIAAGTGYSINIATTSGTAQGTVRWVEIDYDHP